MQINKGTSIVIEGGTGGDGSGSDGKSAYEIAVINGFVGTQEERLDSLIGPKGDNGTSADLYDAIVSAVGGTHTTLPLALADGAKTIFIRKGIYDNTDTITINTPGVTIIGESKKDTIIRFITGADGIAYFSNNGYMTNLTLDGQTHNSGSVYIIGDGNTPGNEDLTIGNNNVIDNCIIKGPNNTFAIYAAGPTYTVGGATLQGFEDNGLHTGNIIRNCELHSSRNGDAFSFSLQKNGSFINNVCYGGRIAFYMCRDSSCSENSPVGSSNQGIFVAGPCYNNTINGNTIFGANSSGIKIQNQLEHTPLLSNQGVIGNTLSNNTIRESNGNGIEMSGTSSNPIYDNTIIGNAIDKCVNHSIYMQDAKNNIIKGNILKNPKYTGGDGRGSGIYMVNNVCNNILEGNLIDGINYHTAISNREDNSCTGNIVKGNIIKGTNTERTIRFQSNETIIEGNAIEGGNYAGIRLLDANYCQIKSNKCKNNTNDANATFAEIWLQGSSSYNMISDNLILCTASNKALNGINIDGLSCTYNMVTRNKGDGTTGLLINNTGFMSDIL